MVENTKLQHDLEQAAKGKSVDQKLDQELGKKKAGILLEHVLKNATKGDPQNVINTIDAFCAKEWMMNLGPEKGKYVLDTIKKHKPMVGVEYGGYCGYSALVIAHNQPENAHFYSIEISEYYSGIARQIIEFAGLKDKVTILTGTASTEIDVLKEKYGVQKIDLLFIDHWKDLYVDDYLIAENKGLIQSGSVVIADNIVFPGSPKYKEFMMNNKDFDSQYIESTLEYTPDTADAIIISVRK